MDDIAGVGPWSRTIKRSVPPLRSIADEGYLAYFSGKTGGRRSPERFELLPFGWFVPGVGELDCLLRGLDGLGLIGLENSLKGWYIDRRQATRPRILDRPRMNKGRAGHFT